MKAIIFCCFFLLEYFFIFLLNYYYIYIFLLYKYIKKENSYLKKRIDTIYIINENIYKKKEKKMNNNINNLYRIYNRRRFYLGFAIVYTQMFLRKVKEFKNYIMFYYIYKLKKIYNNLKIIIINYSLFIYLWSNYYLIFYLEKKKKYLLKLFFLFYFNMVYIKVRIKKIILINIFFKLIK